MNKNVIMNGRKMQVQLSAASVDLTLMEAIKNLSIDEWMEIKSIEEDIVYEMPKLSSLKDCLINPMNSFDFYMILGQIAKSLKILDTLGLSHNSILWDLDSIYMSSVTRECRMIFYPNNEYPLEDLMEDLIYSWKLSNSNDMYVSKFVYAFKKKTLDADDLIQYISSQNQEVSQMLELDQPFLYTLPEIFNQEVVTIENDILDVKDEDLDFVPSMYTKEDPHLSELESTFAQSQIMEEEDDSLLEESKVKNAIYISSIDKAFADPSPVEDGSEVTSSQSPILILTRISTGEKIRIDRDGFEIGKSKYVDGYIVEGNGAVSRKHCKFTIKGDRFFLTDLGSANGTFVLGNRIAPQSEIRVFNGDTLKLGNEEFSVEIL